MRKLVNEHDLHIMEERAQHATLGPHHRDNPSGKIVNGADYAHHVPTLIATVRALREALGCMLHNADRRHWIAREALWDECAKIYADTGGIHEETNG